MQTALLAILATGSLSIAIGTADCMYLLLWKPEQTSVPVYIRQPRWRKWRLYGSYMAALIGLNYILYQGIVATLWFIPDDWKYGDGWIGGLIGMLLGFWATFLFLNRLSTLAQEKAKIYWQAPVSHLM